MSELKWSGPKYLVKFGHLYSCGRPYCDCGRAEADGDGFSLMLTPRRTKALAMPREIAAGHAVAWAEQAVAAGFPAPRVVRLVLRK